MIEELENRMIPKGTVDLIGLGRLGIKTGLNLIQVHRGGPRTINAFDGQRISESDIVFLLKGGKVGEFKVDFLKRLCTHSPDYRNYNGIPEYINKDNMHLIKGDVVVIEIAGGNTIPLSAEIIKHAHKNGSKTIGTAGVFGIGEESIVVKDISEFDNSNPAIQELRKEGITKNHKIISTNKFIKDNIPITPYVLTNIANTLTMEILKSLI